MKLNVDPDWLIRMARAEEKISGGVFAAGALIPKTNQWCWKMGWCNRYEIPPSKTWVWDLSEKAFNIYQNCIGRVIYDAESSKYGVVANVRVIPNGNRLDKTKLIVNWEDDTTTQAIDLRSLHCWKSSYSFI